MKTYYTAERNAQIVIALLKAHSIKKVIASPGATNVCLVASMQQDPFFEMYSSVDERSAAYMACGMAAESGEPVVLSCTGATAARNYASGLTEAFYRKLPVLAITSTQPIGRIGHHVPQVTDRRNPPADEVKLSVYLPMVHDQEEEWECVTKVNQAILELTRDGGGPVHINLTTMYSTDFSIRELSPVRVIKRIGYEDELPTLSADRIAIFVGAHRRWSERLTNAVDDFCEKYNGVVICDQTSNYRGKYGVDACLVANQINYDAPCCSPDIMLHIGEITGAYMGLSPKQVWRISPDGEMRDTFKKLRYVFDMDEVAFFERYAVKASSGKRTLNYHHEWLQEREKLEKKIPEIPFSNAWIAQKTLPELPVGSVLHLGILNSLRTWNYCRSPKDILVYCNTGGFGIDGCVSSLIGASLSNPMRLYFGVVGDLAFFYDMNVLGNRHILGNIRLMVVNNGNGFEFKYHGSFPARSGLENSVEDYIGAAGHYGKQSSTLLKHYAEDLGFMYLSASTKEEYQKVLKIFVSSKMMERPIVLEVFTQSEKEEEANKIMETLEMNTQGMAKQLAKNILGEKGVQAVKKILNK